MISKFTQIMGNVLSKFEGPQTVPSTQVRKPNFKRMRLEKPEDQEAEDYVELEDIESDDGMETPFMSKSAPVYDPRKVKREIVDPSYGDETPKRKRKLARPLLNFTDFKKERTPSPYPHMDERDPVTAKRDWEREQAQAEGRDGIIYEKTMERADGRQRPARLSPWRYGMPSPRNDGKIFCKINIFLMF